MDELPGGSRVQSFIGVVVAIIGNVVISLALNCQKLAHKKLEEAASAPKRPSLSTHQSQSSAANGRDRRRPRETTPLKPLRSSFARYSSFVSSPFRSSKKTSRSNYIASGPYSDEEMSDDDVSPRSRMLTDRENGPSSLGSHYEVEEVDDLSTYSDTGSPPSEAYTPQKTESDYLKSKLWWFGFALMNIGEIGNFLSYGFAPASLVAPLGAFALIANCFFAPLMLKEKFQKLDLLGLALCIVGIITIVIGGKTSDIRLDPDGLIGAISQPIFIAYSIICVVAACTLAVLSNRRIGQEVVWIDTGLCGLFGGFTVLSTKGVSTLLSLAWIQIFKFWITYPLILTLLLTGVAQIRYLNRALMKFDSKVVIPTQFVLFNLSAIVGSAVLYRDFDKLPFERMVIFLYGCAATFLGVFVLARPATNTDGPVEESGDATDTASEAGTARPGSAQQHRGSFTFSPTAQLAHHQGLPTAITPAIVPSTSTSGSIRRVRPRSSSTTIGLSPGKYLLLATEAPAPAVAIIPASPSSTSVNSAQPTVVATVPIIGVPITRQQSLPMPGASRSGRLSYNGSGPLPARMTPSGSYGAYDPMASRSRGTSRSRSRERGGGDRDGGASSSPVASRSRPRVQSIE
ncbi:DUF803-domain-containing protein [Clavulina sp. PMI_390]|nr:DUF803-domain-containing protein [Clavulina sp. PMI_390]